MILFNSTMTSVSLETSSQAEPPWPLKGNTLIWLLKNQVKWYALAYSRWAPHALLSLSLGWV